MSETNNKWEKRFEKIVDNTLQIVWLVLIVVMAIWFAKMVFFE